MFDLYSIGIGPSSSHTVGPMRAAALFVDGLVETGELDRVCRVRAELFGSLGATGRGHGTDRAVLLGLRGEDPETVDVGVALDVLDRTRESGSLRLAGRHTVPVDVAEDLVLHRRVSLPGHSNGMRFTAYGAGGVDDVLTEGTYYSVGGGFVVDEAALEADRLAEDSTQVPYPFTTGDELLDICLRHDLRISDVVLANELTWRTESEVRDYLLRVWAVMQECVDAGCRTEGVLPGGLQVRRRAPGMARRLREMADDPSIGPSDWANLYALAVNEENAGGGRVVTAPTNGAAGIIPSVLHYYCRWWHDDSHDSHDDAVVRFLLTAAAIGMLCKMNASISGAEVGCQGEVGSASAMAAAGLCEVMGGTPQQVENAAEIGIEHNLGLTCDPIGGLVQIPCIERNAMGSIKAINAVRLALHGDGEHFVSLDQVLRTMADTGRDMHEKYKETSTGGLAVNVIEC